MKCEEIHRNLAILPLHWRARGLGPQRVGGGQRVYFGNVGVGLQLDLYE